MSKVYFNNGKLVTANSKILVHEGVVPPTYTDESYFTFDALNNSITRYSLEGPKDVVVPPTIGGVNVENIATDAFFEVGLTSIILPNTLVSISDGAFNDNTSLTSITFPSSLRFIGMYVFTGCTSLTNVVFNEGLLSIGEDAFAKLPLSSLTLPSTLLAIGERAFQRCNFSSVAIPDSVANIGSNAFAGVSESDITLGAGFTSFWLATGSSLENSIGTNGVFPLTVNGTTITSIADGAFFDQPYTSITIPEGYTSIGDSALRLVGTVTEVYFPDSLNLLGATAFYGYGESSNITTVRFGNNVLISSGAFENQPIVNITIGSNCTLDNSGSLLPLGLYGSAFKTLYDGNGKLAGVYNYSGGTWTKTA